MATLTQDIILEEINVEGYERVVKCSDPATKMVAIIAIHDTRLGPALGGTRIFPYATFDDAMFDVLRLSKGMTYKAALAESGLGGGKSVIIADPKTEKTPEMMRSFGRAVEALEGKYICAEDYGCTTEDCRYIREETRYVVGLDHEKSSGNPAPFTAWGVFRGIEATVEAAFGDVSLKGKKVALQGLGSVGMLMAEHLFWHGADLIVADIDEEKCQEAQAKFGAQIVSVDEILSVESDVVVPCALGGIINPETIKNLKCKVIAGATNNQLLNESDIDLLEEKGILYAPDFVINAGGLINVEFEVSVDGYVPTVARNKVSAIYDVLKSIYNISKQNGVTTLEAAYSLAEHRLQYGIGKRQETLCFHH